MLSGFTTGMPTTTTFAAYNFTEGNYMFTLSNGEAIITQNSN